MKPIATVKETREIIAKQFAAHLRGSAQ